MSSSDSDIHCGQVSHRHVASFLSPVLIIELLLGLPGNLMALYVFCHRLGHWRPTNLFLFNLVLADFLLLVNLPFRIDNMIRGENWVFGDAWCRINLFMLAVNRSASIAFMTAVAVDRYFKIAHPHHKVNLMSSRQAAGIACFIWTVVILLRVPLLTENLLKENKTEDVSLCRSFQPYENPPPGILLHYMVYILEFFFSLVLLLFCSLRIYCILRHRKTNKKMNTQAMRKVLVIIGVFTICFCPGVTTGLIALYLKRLGNEYCPAFKHFGEVFVFCIGFTYLNSVLDPVIYVIFSSMFRNTLKQSINRFRLVKLPLHF